VSQQLSELLNQANDCLRQGDLRQAEELGQRALKQHPRSPQVLEVLAATAFQDARYDEARMFLSRCRKLKPKEAGYSIREAQIFAEEGRFAEAVAALERLAKQDPRARIPTAWLASLHRILGNADRARELLKPLLRQGEGRAEAACEWAELELSEGKAEEAIALITETLADKTLPPEMRRRLLFVCGRAHDKLKQPEEAFAAFAEANTLFEAKFDEVEFVKLTDRLIEAMSREALKEMPRATENGEAAVFIAGMPRSGTTLVERIIDAHPKAVGGGEMPYLTRLVRHLPQEAGGTAFPECVSDLTPKTLSRLAREYLRRLRGFGRRAERVVNKNLDNHLYVGLVSFLLPGARVIRIDRDPLDCGLSCFSMPLLPENQPWAMDLKHIALAQREFNRLMDHWQEVAETPILRMRYEDLVRSPEEESRRLIDFLGLAWDDACLKHHETRRVATTLSHEQAGKPVYTTSVKRSDRYAEQLKPLREALREYGALGDA
jgi:tetratricopeptide (TPR) repeat protein